MKKALILIIGMPGSGKSFAASVIKKHFHSKVFENGDIIREEIKRRGWKYTPENDKKMRLWFHSGREHLLFERMKKKINHEKGLIVIVGVRSPKEFAMYKMYFKGKIFLIEIRASFKVRAQRELERGRFGKQESIKYLKDRDRSETSDLVGLKCLLKEADYTIDNSKLTKKQTEKRIIGLIKRIIR